MSSSTETPILTDAQIYVILDMTHNEYESIDTYIRKGCLYFSIYDYVEDTTTEMGFRKRFTKVVLKLNEKQVAYLLELGLLEKRGKTIVTTMKTYDFTHKYRKDIKASVQGGNYNTKSHDSADCLPSNGATS